MDASGAGSITVSGEVESQDITVTGAVAYRGSNLLSSTATVASMGVETITVWVTDTFDATVLGVGDVAYYGTPSSVTTNLLGVGMLEARGPK